MQYVLTPDPVFMSHYSFRANLSSSIEKKITDVCMKVSKVPGTSVEK